ncbi:hypothetical protein LOTGIDRAFT_155943 [Lottia gigantea]|uniref:SH2 domain-containing protein n=1 Tax=Lottia gigantea TaxID=225164 RepID=V3ZPV7_LOTGI|nr:hypothetical protein LOTGIDRAFT_155943 [Lottia gigantea]ESO82901.1 hypothetical protein LOTGIDRAFT_155943 [Lottia gigantea]
MCHANDILSEFSPIDVLSLSDNAAYDYLQQPVIDEDSDDGESSDSDYDKIEEEILQKHRKEKRPLPSVPEEPKSSRTLPPTRDIKSSPATRRASVDEGRRTIPPIPENEDSKSSGSLPQKAIKTPRKKPEPPVALKPNPVANYGNRNKTLKEKDFMLESSDRDEVKKILSEAPDGTFLVRNSRSDNAKVLAVKSDAEVREYKIFIQDSRVSIDKIKYYNSIQDMLKHYKDAKLPKRDTTLGKAYSFLDLSAI